MNVPSSTPSETADEPIDQLEQLKPDDLVDQRRAAAADEQQQQRRQIAAWIHEGAEFTSRIADCECAGAGRKKSEV